MMRIALFSLLVAALASCFVANADDCAQSTSPAWRESMGNSSFPFDADSISIVSQDDGSVVFTVNQVWVEDGTPMFAVHYRSLADGEEVCETNDIDSDEVVPYEDSKTYTAECLHGYAEIGIYLWVGDGADFVPEECESCRAPDDNYVGHYVTVPCVYDSNCEPSATPTGAPSGVPSSSPSNSPSGAPSLPPSKPPTDPPTNPPTDPPTEPPTDPPTEPPTDPPTNPPTDPPTEPPTGSPSTPPSASPTGGPTDGPSAGPSSPPSEGELRVLPPVSCEESVEAKLKTTAGNDEAYPDFLPPITIVTQDVDSVTVSVNQTFDENGVGMLAVGFRNELLNEECVMNNPVDFAVEQTVTAQCLYGYAEINLYVYTGSDFSVEDCEACTLPDEIEYVAYAYTVPCVPVCKPDIPDCLDGPLTTLADIGDETDVCVYSDSPVMVRPDDMTGDAVNFVVQNTWTDDVTSVSVSYTDASGEATCAVFDSGSAFETSGVLQASCTDGTSTIVISVHSSEIEWDADLGAFATNTCATPDGVGTCAYEVVLPCESGVLCGSTGAPSDSPTAVPSGSPSSSPSSSPSTGSPTGWPTEIPTTSYPTQIPTGLPTTSFPTQIPTGLPSTSYPTQIPTQFPTESAEPTGCLGESPPIIVNEICYDTGGEEMDTPIDLPPDAIVITAQGNDELTFEISQAWVDTVTGLAVRSGLDECVVEDGIAAGLSYGPYDGDCLDGIAGVTIVVFFEEDFEPDDCEACNVDDINAMGGDKKFCAYHVEIPCEEMPVDCGKPSASPSGSYYPSSVPSASPTKSALPSSTPSTSPSEPPTGSPTVSPTPVPTPPPTPPPTSPPTSSPTATPSASPSENPTNSPSGSPSSSPSDGPTGSPSSSPTGSPSGSPSDSPSSPPTGSPSSPPTDSPSSPPSEGPTSPPTSSPSASPSGSYFPSSDPTSAPTESAAPSEPPTGSPSSPPTDEPSASPSDSPTGPPSTGPSESPTGTPSSTPSSSPSNPPTDSPSSPPTGEPSSSPSDSPSSGPTDGPSSEPSAGPSEPPTGSPSSPPTGSPSAPPTDKPSLSPSDSPSSPPSGSPSAPPTGDPTTSPSESPSGSYYPSSDPTSAPTVSAAPSTPPTGSPSSTPTDSPSNAPSDSPTAPPSTSPSEPPTGTPSTSPSSSPSSSPSEPPTGGPTSPPTDEPSATPSTTPSSSPSDPPTGGPTSPPTDEPSATPSTTPSSSPSDSPTAYPTESMEPTRCTEPMPPQVIDAVCMTTGGETMDLIPLPPGAIITSDIIGDDIDLQISQIWSDTAGLAIEAGMDNCIIKGDLNLGATEDISTSCTDGYASATVVVYLDDDFEPDECDACNVDELALMGGNSTFCAYRIEIPCGMDEVDCGEPSAAPSGSYYPSSDPTAAPTKSAQPSAPPTGTPSASPTSPPSSAPSDSPTSSPSATPTPPPSSSPSASPSSSPTTQSPSASPTMECPLSDATLVSNEGDTLPPENLVELTFANTTHVTFKVKNSFTSTVSSVYTQYHSGSFGETECLSEDNVEETVEEEFTAKCMRNTAISIVNVWMTDCAITNTFLVDADNAEIPECCHPGEVCKTVQYTYKLPCENPCPTDGASAEVVADEAPVADGGRRHQRRLNNRVTEIIQQRKAHEGSTKEFEDIVGHAEDNGSSDHFCVIEDYPCGVGNDKVHVCHYSARDGYKTFCVPEADSDALRFYPKDYCGPCVGGYAAAQ